MFGRAVVRTVGIALLGGAVLTVTTVVRQADQMGRAATPAGADVGAAAVSTPLWSPRRMPAVIVAAASQQKEAQYAGAIAGFAGPGRCVAVDGPGGPLARVGTATSLAPASTEKLLTGAAALQVLGPAHVFNTSVATTALLSDGVLGGDLYLVGGGDPVLATPARRQRLASSPLTAGQPTTALADLATAVAATGVHTVAGSIVADDSHGDTLRYLPSLKPSERRTDIGPLGALTVDDGFGPNGVAASDPALLTASSFRVLLKAHGVFVSGTIRRGSAPAAARTVASVASPRLDAIVANMLTVSDNYTAEMLVRAVGSAAGGGGSTAAGIRAVVAALAGLGVPTSGVSLVDGSGLSPQDRVTCPALLAAVELGDRAQERALRDGLSIAGRTGTLAQRFVRDPLAGRLRAKTGHIDGVVSLAGVIATGSGTVSFAFVANGAFSVVGGESLQDQVAHLVAAYPAIAHTDRLVPAPSA